MIAPHILTEQGDSILNVNAFCTTLILLAAFEMTAAADMPSRATTPLDLNGQAVKRQEVSSSVNGLTSTTVFYTLDEHRVVVVIHVDNTKAGFPVTGKVCAFNKGTDAESIAKWLNNQHSDGLFPHAPEPTATVPLPAEACHSLGSKLLGSKKVIDTTYNHYSVEIKLSAVTVNDQVRLQEHKDLVNVYVVTE